MKHLFLLSMNWCCFTIWEKRLSQNWIHTRNFAIHLDNFKNLNQNGTKIANIGRKTVNKMKKHFEDGIISKLQEMHKQHKSLH